MKLSDVRVVYFIGIGGIGMSSIARYFLASGAEVFGYDKSKTALTDTLESEGAKISYNNNGESIAEFLKENLEGLLVVYTPAIPKESEIIIAFRENNIKLWKRSEVLGLISINQFCIAVAGTHGKTTTTCLIAHILHHSGFGCSAFLGGIATNYGTNFLSSGNNVVVVEADEYDRSFLALYPDIAVITSMDADHLDIYENKKSLEDSFNAFAGQVKPMGVIFKEKDLPVAGIGYSCMKAADVSAINIAIKDAAFVFDYTDANTTIRDLHISLPGYHNIENALAAIAVALRVGIKPHLIPAALESFKGVKRRFEYIVKSTEHIYIDDYAHHPEELRACFKTVRQLYPGKKLTVVFQPHLFSRTRDFLEDFAQVLATVDRLLLCDVYPAREQPIKGISSENLIKRIQMSEKELCHKDEVVGRIAEILPELLVTVGAGDVDTLVEPLKNLLNHA